MDDEKGNERLLVELLSGLITPNKNARPSDDEKTDERLLQGLISEFIGPEYYIKDVTLNAVDQVELNVTIVRYPKLERIPISVKIPGE